MLAETEDARIPFVAEAALMDELLIVGQVRVGMDHQVTRFLERLVALLALILPTRVRLVVVGQHVVVVMQLRLVGFVALVAAEVDGVADVVIVMAD